MKGFQIETKNNGNDNREDGKIDEQPSEEDGEIQTPIILLLVTLKPLRWFFSYQDRTKSDFRFAHA